MCNRECVSLACVIDYVCVRACVCACVCALVCVCESVRGCVRT